MAHSLVIQDPAVFHKTHGGHVAVQIKLGADFFFQAIAVVAEVTAANITPGRYAWAGCLPGLQMAV
jgi:hypothetical protein